MNSLDVSEKVKVVVPNTFIKAHFSKQMDVNSQKLFRMAISQCRMGDEDFGTYTITGTELADAMSVGKSNVYHHIDKWTTDCQETFMVLQQGKKGFVKFPIFHQCSYVDGVLTLQLDERMKPLVLDIQKKLGFTQYELSKVLTMKGKYSIRLFELMVSEMRNQKVYGNQFVQIELSVEEIRKQTSTETTFKQIGELKKKVLAIAEREIEKNMGVKLEREDIKKGRTVVGFLYTIHSQSHIKNASPDLINRARKAELIRKRADGVLTPEEDDELQELILELDQMKIDDFI